MSHYRLSTTARVAGEYTHTFYPHVQRPTSKYPVLLLPAASTPTIFVGASAWPHAQQLASVLASGSAASSGQGMPCQSHYLAGNSFANDTAMSRITSMLSDISTQTGCSSAKAHLVGISMGGGAALRYAALNPTKVASLNLIVPMASLLNLYKQNPSNAMTTLIATAWGLTATTMTVTCTNGSANLVATVGSFTSAMQTQSWIVVKNTGTGNIQTGIDTTIPTGTVIQTFTDATHATMSAAFTGTTGSYTIIVAQPLPTSGSPNADLAALAPSIAGIPTRLFYSTVDPYIQVADVTAIKNAIGSSATAIAIDSTSGHTDGTVNEVAAYNSGSNFSDLVSNLVTNGA